MALDDVLKGLSVFQSGMLQMGRQQALNDANQTLHKINTEMADEGERMQAATQLSSQLAMRLAGLGASGAELEAATSFAPSPGAQFQIQAQKDMAGQARTFSAGEAEKDRKFRASEGAKDRAATLAGILAKTKEAREVAAMELPPNLSVVGNGPISQKSVQAAQAATTKGGVALSNIAKIRGIAEDVGTESFDMFGSEGADMKKAYNELIGIEKDLFELGALAGPDIGLLEKIVPDPNAFATSGSTFLNRLQQYEDNLIDKVAFQLRAKKVSSPALSLFEDLKSSEAFLADPARVKAADPAEVNALKSQVRAIRNGLKKEVFGVNF